jgi:hypothetical protein
MLLHRSLSTATERRMVWACAFLLSLLAWTGLILAIIVLL